MSIFSTLSSKLLHSFPRQIKRDQELPTGIARLPGAFINQGNIQNLQVTIKNYNYPSKYPDPTNSENSDVTQIKEGNIERITVIKNLYYE